MSSAASFIHHGNITDEVKSMRLENINLSEVAHASALADVNVTRDVCIDNVTGDIAPLISRVKCRALNISKMNLSTEDTAALVLGMQTSVEEVYLGVMGLVELDMDTLLTYDGRGHCRGVLYNYNQAMETCGNQLASWAETMGWSVKKYSYSAVIEKKTERICAVKLTHIVT